MFDLEPAIADWRKQMRDAGIQAPALAELETHLREDIARQTKLGLMESEAFAFATRMVGPPAVLSREFAKTGGFPDFLSRRRTFRITLSVTRLLGLFWLACLLSRFGTSVGVFNGQSRFAFLVADTNNGQSLTALLIVVAALAGSVLLIFDSKLGRKIVRVVALTCLASWVIQHCLDCLFAYMVGPDPNFIYSMAFHDLIAEKGLVLAFMIVSILILHLPETANVRTTIKL